MSIKAAIQDAIKKAMLSKETARLECLRMAKGALLLKEKAGPKDQEISDEEAIGTLRSEVRKRQESMETYRGVGKLDEVAKLEQEILTIEEFLPKQLSPEQLEAKVREYLAEHPEINHAGKLTGALKKELGDLADGKLLNELCRKAIEG